MAGIYIHIPFCVSKCHYCDFYSITTYDKNLKKRFLEAIIKELSLKKTRISNGIKTIYFGGGTPSLLDAEDIEFVISNIEKVFDLSNLSEITLEANPDDLSFDYVKELKYNTRVNRLSIGVQSFIDEELKFLGRRHTAFQAKEAIRIAQNIGFDNITIDLIYAIPYGLNPLESLTYNLNEFFSLDLPHLSAYGLTIEENTRFGQWYAQGKLNPIDEDTFTMLYSYLINQMEKNGYLHYEISNFARQGYISKHNFSYWIGEQYLGLGPAAHSFDGVHRYWNQANLFHYLDQLEKGILPEQKEFLSERDRFNEYLLTRLRTYLGIDADFLSKQYPKYWKKIKAEIEQYRDEGFLEQVQNRFRLTIKGKFIADNIIANLFI